MDAFADLMQRVGRWAFLERARAHRVQLDLSYDYRTNAALYAAWQKRIRATQPKTITFWGQGDIFFTPGGGEAYLRDLPDAILIRLDSGQSRTAWKRSPPASEIPQLRRGELIGG